MNYDFYVNTSYKISKLITKRYSTSFSLATSLLEKEKQEAIYAIYGFVRLADEVVDSFEGFEQEQLLQKLNEDMDYALTHRVSTNPILQSFSLVVEKYKIDRAHINAFMESMRFDLSKQTYTSQEEIKKYIYGSADVVGLMCLKIFCDGQKEQYHRLQEPAQRLGSAFQKVNFLRDLSADIDGLGRVYFPEIALDEFNQSTKAEIESSIEEDFNAAWDGLKKLPGRSKLAVALAFFYYQALFKKIKGATPQAVLTSRMRISNMRKYLIIVSTGVKYKLKLI